uniref:U1 small nuclear ribonucleoprotein C n=1 Tax=Opuntia streptacantha TaxID=393608 RepID=A0A7C8YBG4_OPUST
MPRYYCDYCDTYLTHDSPSVRKQHNAGYKHKANVRTYYQQFEEQQTQSLIDQRIKEHLSGQAAFGQIGAAYAAWRPGVRPPILPAPLPIPGAVPPGAPMGVRLPVLPRPVGLPVYGAAPVAAPIPGQPGAPAAPPAHSNGLPGPPPMNAPGSTPGATAPGSNGAPPTASQPMYQGNPGGGNFGGVNMAPASSFASAGGNPAYPATSAAENFNYAQAPNTNH